MSKRLCTSLLHAPRRSRQSLPRCSIHSTFSTLRDEFHPRHTPSKRPFTSSARCASGVSAHRGVQRRKQSQPSMAVQIKEKQKTAQRDGSVLDHVGFLPGTFVPPTGKNLASWFSNPRGRWKVLQLKGLNWWYYLTGRVSAFWLVKPRVKLERGKLPGIARTMYETMYSHFATGNLQDIENILSPGLLGSLRARIAQRTPNTGLKWTLHQYLSAPKVVSYRFQALPNGPNTDKFGISQAVVQINSLQSLTKTKRMRLIDPMTNQGYIKEATVDDQGNMVRDHDLESYRTRVAKMTTEYLVLQRFVKHSRPGEWHIWGTAEETMMRDITGKEKKSEAELMSKV